MGEILEDVRLPQMLPIVRGINKKHQCAQSHTGSHTSHATMNTSKEPEKPLPTSSALRASIKEKYPLIDQLNNLSVLIKGLVESSLQAEARLRAERDTLRNERNSLHNKKLRLFTQIRGLRRELYGDSLGENVETESNRATVGRGDKRKTGRKHEKST